MKKILTMVVLIIYLLVGFCHFFYFQVKRFT